MPSLREIQTRFLQGVFGSVEQECVGIVGRGIEPAARLGIYANNARVNFVESLRDSFPAVLRLVGDDYFLQCALRFRDQFPSVTGDLQRTGVGFSDFLARLHGEDGYRYLGDVARLEWCWQEALIAADGGLFPWESLSGRDPATYEALRFVLHPSVRLFASVFPCLRIWEANLDATAEPAPIDLGEGADRLVILRSAARMGVHRLSVGEFAFLEAIQAGEPFGMALVRGQEADAEFAAAAALRRAVIAGVIVDCL
jgi:hypothetical protein